MKIDLPTPPTSNHAYFVAHNRKVLSKEGRDYKQTVATLLRIARWKPLEGPVSVSFWWRRERKAGDLMNREKLCLDALKGFAWHDDSQIVEAHFYRSDDKANPGVTVEVTSC